MWPRTHTRAHKFLGLISGDSRGLGCGLAFTWAVVLASAPIFGSATLLGRHSLGTILALTTAAHVDFASPNVFLD